MKYWVYILSSRKRLTYVGIAGNVSARVREHRWHRTHFTTKYRITRLVFVEEHPDRDSAARREKEIKGWSRDKKHALISARNPDWLDLTELRLDT